MRDPLPSAAEGETVPAVVRATVAGEPAPDPAPAEPAPANRAARRGRSGKQAPSGAVRTGSGVHARAAQGRRINPVRRTG